jgi:putative heme degradation protein
MATPMAASQLPTSTALSLACFSVVGTLALPAVHQFYMRMKSKRKAYEQLSDYYEDQDGAATEESQAAYSDTVARSVLLVSAAVGSVDALVTAILTTTRTSSNLVHEQWLQFATWVSFSACCLWELG